MNAIEVNNLTKSFGQVHVLRGVSLTVRQGEVFTLLGENGAGKSTLINILTTLSRADAGTVTVLGQDVEQNGNAIRQKISLNAQATTLDAEFSGYANLKLIAQLRGGRNYQQQLDTLIERLSLGDFIQRKVSTYSGGMRRRLDLAMSLIGDPAVIFLDEPTTGVDPKNRLALWQIIRELRDAGKTVFLTTQYLNEADQLSDHIAFIKDGQIVRQGTPGEIKQVAQPGYQVRIAAVDWDQAAPIFAAHHVPATVDTPVALTAEGAPAVLQALLAAGVTVQSYTQDEANLETVFMNINQ